MTAQPGEKAQNPDSRYVTLQAISTRTGVTTRRVRYLERAGLISPARSDEHFRLYHEETVERVMTIERLTNDLGVNLAGVEVILNMREQILALRAMAGLQSEEPRNRA
jgi:MerR family transcriptional regulator/heat shock protein HspR